MINIGKLINSESFYENLLSQAITDEDRRFCEKVKFALDKEPAITLRSADKPIFRTKKASKNSSSEKKAAVYTGTRNLYGDMVTAAKSLLINSDVDLIYLFVEDDKFPYELPPDIKTLNVKNQEYFPKDGPNMTSQYSYMALMRAALAYVFPDYDKILSLDVDTIANKDCSEIWDIDLDGYYFAACKEPHRSKNGLLYTNAGVTLFNLKKLREDKKVDEVIHCLNVQYMRWVDQDAMNYLCQGHILELKSDYNVNNFTIPTGNPKILHFAGEKNWQDKYEIVKRYREISFEDIYE